MRTSRSLLEKLTKTALVSVISLSSYVGCSNEPTPNISDNSNPPINQNYNENANDNSDPIPMEIPDSEGFYNMSWQNFVPVGQHEDCSSVLGTDLIGNFATYVAINNGKISISFAGLEETNYLIENAELNKDGAFSTNTLPNTDSCDLQGFIYPIYSRPDKIIMETKCEQTIGSGSTLCKYDQGFELNFFPPFQIPDSDQEFKVYEKLNVIGGEPSECYESCPFCGEGGSFEGEFETPIRVTIKDGAIFFNQIVYIGSALPTYINEDGSFNFTQYTPFYDRHCNWQGSISPVYSAPSDIIVTGDCDNLFQGNISCKTFHEFIYTEPD